MVERFDLERFGWNAPDQLEVSGRFHGREEPPAEPVLIVTGGGAPHRLQGTPDSAPADDGAWRAVFVWEGVPVGVESATLELGPDIVIDLPPPGADQPLSLDVQRADAGGEPVAPPPVGRDVAMQAQRLAAEQHAEELRAALERAEEELARARSDLETERSGRAADAERFRDGLAQVQASAEHALTAERGETEALRDELRAARGQAEREAEARREQAAAGEELRQRLSALEDAGTEAGEVRSDAERLLERLTKLAGALDPGT
jgi:hypothetical protein